MGGYWKVRSEVYAFDTKEQAEAFRDAFIDAFCAMPESEGYGSSHVIVFCDSDDMDDTAPTALAASPEVAALIREAEARCRVDGMERIASELHQMAMVLPDYESNKILENRSRAIRAEAAALRGEKEPT